jgi:hypothetical protein
LVALFRGKKEKKWLNTYHQQSALVIVFVCKIYKSKIIL